MAPPPWPKESSKATMLLPSILLAVVLALIFKQKTRKRKINFPPGPPTVPIIGNILQLGKMPHKSLRCLSEKYGPIMFLQLGQIPTIVISSSRLAKEALKTHDLALSGRPKLFAAKYIFYGWTDIALSSYGAYWRSARKICMLELLNAKRVQSFSFAREKEVAQLVHTIAENYPASTNLSKMFALYANNIVCRVALGKTFSAEENHKHGFEEMLKGYKELIGGFNIGDYYPSLPFLQSLTGMKSKLLKTCHRFDKFLDEVVREHLNPQRKYSDRKDLVDVLLDIQKNGSSEMPLTMDNVKAIILDMFIAGTNTVSVTLDWAMTELIMNPKILEKAQAEIRKTVGKRRSVEEDDLPQLYYIKAVVKEVLRLHTPAPLLVPRESMEDVYIDGYRIPAKTRIYVNAWAIARDPETWQNPDVFEPERFVGSKIEFKGQDFELIPFGAGRRICPGITFGIAVIELALAQLLHSFEWKLPAGIEAHDIDNTETFSLSVKRACPLHVIAKPHFEKNQHSNIVCQPCS